jgi:hypothetical protein
MRRAFAIDVLACLRGGEQLRVIATVEDPLAVRQILAATPLGPGPSSSAQLLEQGRRGTTDQKSGSCLNPVGLSRRQVRRSVISNRLPSSFRSSFSVTTGTGNSGCSAD